MKNWQITYLDGKQTGHFVCEAETEAEALNTWSESVPGDEVIEVSCTDDLWTTDEDDYCDSCGHKFDDEEQIRCRACGIERHNCTGCGRGELECSGDPCLGVRMDRGEYDNADLIKALFTESEVEAVVDSVRAAVEDLVYELQNTAEGSQSRANVRANIAVRRELLEKIVEVADA